MKVTQKMRLERALEHIEAEMEREQQGLAELEDIKIREVIIARNKKTMYIAEIEQMIRNIRAEIQEIEMTERIMNRCGRKEARE